MPHGPGLPGSPRATKGKPPNCLITDVVKSWDAEEVSRAVELEIGRDLQYIRINGTLVGGTVGLLLHAGMYLAGT